MMSTIPFKFLTLSLVLLALMSASCATTSNESSLASLGSVEEGRSNEVIGDYSSFEEGGHDEDGGHKSWNKGHVVDGLGAINTSDPRASNGSSMITTTTTSTTTEEAITASTADEVKLSTAAPVVGVMSDGKVVDEDIADEDHEGHDDDEEYEDDEEYGESKELDNSQVNWKLIVKVRLGFMLSNV